MNPTHFSLTVFLWVFCLSFPPVSFPFAAGLYWNLARSDQEKAIRLFGKKIRWHGLLKPYVLLGWYLLFCPPHWF